MTSGNLVRVKKDVGITVGGAYLYNKTRCHFNDINQIFKHESIGLVISINKCNRFGRRFQSVQVLVDGNIGHISLEYIEKVK